MLTQTHISHTKDQRVWKFNERATLWVKSILTVEAGERHERRLLLKEAKADAAAARHPLLHQHLLHDHLLMLLRLLLLGHLLLYGHLLQLLHLRLLLLLLLQLQLLELQDMARGQRPLPQLRVLDAEHGGLLQQQGRRRVLAVRCRQ